MKLKHLISGLGVAAVLGIAVPAYGAPTKKASGAGQPDPVVAACPTPDGQPAVTDVTYSGDGIVTPDRTNGPDNGATSDDCYRDDRQNESQDVMNGVGDENDPIFGGGWTFLTKVTPGEGVDLGSSLGGFGFTMNYIGPDSDGWFEFNIVPTGGNQSDLPLLIDFAFNIKQGRGFASYFFDDALVYAGENGGTFKVPAFMRGEEDLSHFSLYGRDARDYVCVPGTPECPHNVPEPGSLALLGAGIAGLALIRRRRRD